MRRWGRRVAYALIALAAVVGVLYVAMPPARTAAEGPADPILWIRRPVVKALHHLGILSRSFFGPDDWIPSSASSESWGDAKSFDEAVSATRVTWEFQPVYRGVLWRVGMRATFKVDERGDPKDDPDHLRMWWTSSDGKKTTVADGGPGVPDVATRLRRWRVDGYFPIEAAAFGFDFVKPDGTVTDGDSWSDP